MFQRQKIKQVSLLTLLAFALPLLAGAQDDEETEKERSDAPAEKKESRKKLQERRMQPRQQGSDIEVSDKELEKLVALQQELRPIQMNAREEMKANVQNSDLGQERYMEVRRAQQAGQDPDMNEEEEKQMEEVEKKNKETQEEMKEKMKKAVEEKDMEWERFRKVSQAVRQDPELRKRFQELRRKEHDGQAPQPRKKRQKPAKKEGGR